MKQLKLTFLLTILMGMVGSSAFAYDAMIDEIAYNFSEMKATVVSGGNYSGKVVIPVSITYGGNTYPVTSIGDRAFQFCDGLTSIEIPNSVTSIGNYAFGRTGLTSIEIPNSVTSVGKDAFYRCSGLTSINVNSGNTKYDSRKNCNAIIETSNNTMIAGCKTTIIPNSVTSIGDYAFSGCSGLTSIEIPSSVTSIGDCAFDGCSGLTSIEIPNSVTSIDEYAFCNCSGLISATLGNSVTSIGNWAFGGCSSLTSITIGSSVTSIGDYAFNGCTGLTSISLPDNVKNIKKDSFGNISKVLCKKGTKTLLSLWNAGLIPLEIETEKELNSPYLSISSTTQASVTIKINNFHEEYTYKYDYFAYGDVSVKDDKISITRMRPNYSGEIKSNDMKISLGDVSYSPKSGYLKYTTKNISPRINKVSSTASSIQYTGSYVGGDAKIESIYLDGMEYIEGKTLYLKGLNPNNNYYPKLEITVSYGANYEYTYTYESTNAISTDALTLTTAQPKVVSVGNVVVAAETNLDEEETNVGFEWRRIDWTDDFASNTGTGYLYEGTMEGYIRNLYAEKLWKYRPYYESNSGTRYYGDWVGIDPTNISYFEPTVHTYATISVKGNEATVKGYAMTGTDKIMSQGFKYWTTSATTRRGMAEEDVPADAMTVTAKGQVMTATLKNLKDGTEYCYVAFATTEEGDTFYGELQTFTTEATVLLGDADGDGTVDVNDVTTTINHILGKPVVNFVEKAANVDGDGVIDVNDVQGIIDIALGKTKAAARKMEEVEEHEKTLDPQ